jgi:hypothetical protein
MPPVGPVAIVDFFTSTPDAPSAAWTVVTKQCYVIVSQFGHNRGHYADGEGGWWRSIKNAHQFNILADAKAAAARLEGEVASVVWQRTITLVK